MSARHRPGLLLSLLVGLLLAACGREAPPRAAQPTGTPAQPTADTAGGAPVDRRRALGDPNAPITVIEYSDFQ